MALQLSFAPLAPWWLLAAAAGAVALFLLYACRLRAWRLLWRLAPFSLLLLALAAPHLEEEQRTPLPDIAIVISDHTPSQRLAGREQQRQRALAHVLEQSGRYDNLDVRTLTLKEDARGGSRLFSALQEVMEGLPRERLAGVVVISDGQIHDVPPAEEMDLGTPFHVLLTGDRNEADRGLRVEHAPGFGLVDDVVEVILQVVDFPENAAEEALLRLRLDGAERPPLPVVSGEPIRLRIPLRHAGANILEAEVSPLSGEAFADNNRIALEIQGIRERLPVLLVSGRAHPGMRVWRWLLKGDAAVDLVHFTILRDPSQSLGIPESELSLIPFPVRELFLEKLDEFDLVIFDNYRLRGILPQEYLENILRYVRDGGALLVASGQDFATRHGLYRSVLADVLPVRPTGGLLERQYVPRIEGAGLRHPVTAPLASAAGDWGGWYRLVEGEVLDGDVLMTGLGGRPLLGLHRVGEGRVAQLLSDHIWLWARNYQGGGPHADLLRALAHWLMREPELEEERLWGEMRDGRLVVWRAGMGDAVAPVRVSSTFGADRELVLEAAGAGRWRGEMELGDGAPATDVIRLRSDGLEALVLPRRGMGLEIEDIRARGDLLAPVVEANGGFLGWVGGDDLPRVLRVGSDGVSAGSGWLGLRENGGHVVGSVERVALLRGILALLLLFAALAWCWWREVR